jgi:hypothetical protein
VVRVVDAGGSALPGVTVTMTYPIEHGRHEAWCVTGGTGSAAIWGIPADEVDVSVALSGFDSRVIRGIRLGGTAARLDLEMKLAPIGGDRFGEGIPIDTSGTPIWTPAPVPTPTPTPPDLASIQCSSR